MSWHLEFRENLKALSKKKSWKYVISLYVLTCNMLFFLYVNYIMFILILSGRKYVVLSWYWNEILCAAFQESVPDFLSFSFIIPEDVHLAVANHVLPQFRVGFRQLVTLLLLYCVFLLFIFNKMIKKRWNKHKIKILANGWNKACQRRPFKFSYA